MVFRSDEKKIRENFNRLLKFVYPSVSSAGLSSLYMVSGGSPVIAVGILGAGVGSGLLLQVDYKKLEKKLRKSGRHTEKEIGDILRRLKIIRKKKRGVSISRLKSKIKLRKMM